MRPLLRSGRGLRFGREAVSGMHVEPDIDLAALRARLRERYAMDVVRLEFVPMGIDSWSYVAVSEDEQTGE